MDNQNEPILYDQPGGQPFESLEWHPTNKELLMVGSKMIYIIKIQGSKNTIEQTIHVLKGKLS
jgi:hypothetical protein